MADMAIVLEVHGAAFHLLSSVCNSVVNLVLCRYH